jgi:hypothetical protein
MALDDLLKGIAVFQDGLKQYATTNAINDANEQLLAINQQGLDKNAQLQAHTQVASSLALRLGAAGADAAHIQTLTGQLAPSQGAQYEAGVNADLQNKSQQFQTGEKAKDRANAITLEQMKLDAMSGKGQKKAMEEVAKGFEKRPDVKPLLDNFPKFDEALARINETKGKMGATAAIELAKLGLIRGAAGRVNEMEIKSANESPSARAQLWKKMGLETSGEVPANVQDFWQQVLVRSKEHTATALGAAIDAHAKGAAALNDNVDATALNTGLRAKYSNVLGSPEQQVNQKQQQQQANQATIQAAQAWLQGPEAKANPQKAQAVLQRINQLKNGQ